MIDNGDGLKDAGGAADDDDLAADEISGVGCAATNNATHHSFHSNPFDCHSQHHSLPVIYLCAYCSSSFLFSMSI